MGSSRQASRPIASQESASTSVDRGRGLNTLSRNYGIIKHVLHVRRWYEAQSMAALFRCEYPVSEAFRTAPHFVEHDDLQPSLEVFATLFEMLCVILAQYSRAF